MRALETVRWKKESCSYNSETGCPLSPALASARANVFSYIPSRDGQRFLVNMLLDTAPAPITVIYNWTEGSKKE